MTTSATAPSIKPVTDRDEIIRAMNLMLAPGQLTEIRALEATTAQDRFAQTYSGYFNNPADIAREVLRLTSAKGIYFVPNQVDPALLARSVNKLRPAKKEPLTSDANIVRRLWLLVDCDPVRPAGISSTDDEHTAALDRAKMIRAEMAVLGWPNPVYATSGNGAHLNYSIDLPAKDEGLVARVLAELSRRFSDDAVKIDTSVGNPARIWKLYGTVACKGDASGAACGRPHRLSYVIESPEVLELVTSEQLNAFAPAVKESPAESPRSTYSNRSNGTTLNLADFIRRHNIDTKGPKVNAQGATVYVLPVCPWHSDHTNESAFLMQHASGALSAGCRHESCKGNGWTEYRAKFEGPRQKYNGTPLNQVVQKSVEPHESSPVNTKLTLDPADPLPIAREYRKRNHRHEEGPTLVFHAGEFHSWTGSKWEVLDSADLRARQYRFLEPTQKWVRYGKEKSLVPFQPSRSNVDNILDALKAEAFVKGSPPCWIIDEPNLPPAHEIIAAPNCLLHLKSDGKPVIHSEPTPGFFSPFALDYDVVQRAPSPANWLAFLNQLWPDDAQSIQLLQEWFGYVLTLDTRQQKMLLLVGPKRSGKGTIARVLTRMIGPANVVNPTLSGLATNFGLWPLRQKQLAIVTDARLSGRADQAVITERLLTISGEDSITIDRKCLQPVTEKLSTRITIISNELPRLSDASGALGSRFLVLMLHESFLGREDHQLEDRLMAELPSILLWAIAGWQRLKKRGRFVQPESSLEGIEEMLDLASPISAFIRDWCVTGPAAEIVAKDLYDAWCLWCADQGKDQPGTLQVFGRDLRAAMPRIRITQPRTDVGRERHYHGIKLSPAAVAILAHDRITKQTLNGRKYA